MDRENREKALIDRLVKENDEFNKLYNDHLEYERELETHEKETADDRTALRNRDSEETQAPGERQNGEGSY